MSPSSLWLLVLSTAAALAPATRLHAADTTTAVRFIIGHAACPDGITFELFVGTVTLGAYPASNSCECNTTPLVVSSTDPGVLAAVQGPGCTPVAVQVQDATGSLALAYARVEIDRTATGTESICLFDSAFSGCGDRDICDNYVWPGSTTVPSRTRPPSRR